MGGALVRISDVGDPDTALATAVTDAQGQYAFSRDFLAGNEYFLKTTLEDYFDDDEFLGVLTGDLLSPGKSDVLLSPVCFQCYRIVLGWGPKPKDLDLNVDT